MTIDERTPVLIGAAQFTWRGAAEGAPTPLNLIERVTRAAATDAGLPESRLRDLDSVGVVGFALDAPGALAALRGLTATGGLRYFGGPGNN